jgi:diadenosine tetraphosphate (Ap4A) HIT family hydrolase
LLEETPTFRLIADYAPVIEGHILITPKAHYACFGATPAELDAELRFLKHKVRRFLEQHYAPVVFWEHGVFHQSVFHAHLHCIPFGELTYNPAQALHEREVTSQDDLRLWYTDSGHYFYLEDRHRAWLFPPNQDRYRRVAQEIFVKGIATHGYTHWRTPQERQAEGEALIQSTIRLWHTFQQQEVQYAD